MKATGLKETIAIILAVVFFMCSVGGSLYYLSANKIIFSFDIRPGKIARHSRSSPATQYTFVRHSIFPYWTAFAVRKHEQSSGFGRRSNPRSSGPGAAKWWGFTVRAKMEVRQWVQSSKVCFLGKGRTMRLSVAAAIR